MIKKIRQWPHLLGKLAGKDLLTPLHSEWIKYVWGPEGAEIPRTLMGHRGSYKTTAITEIGPIWYLAFNPERRIAVIRKTFTESAEVLRNISNICMLEEVHDFLGFVWGDPNWTFTTRKAGKIEFSVKHSKTKEGNLTAYGLDSSMTGSHFTDVLGDDCETIIDRISSAEREKTKMIMTEVRTNILDPGGRFRVIGTPWAKDGLFSILPPARKYPVGVTGLLTDEQIKIKRDSQPALLYAVNYELEFQNDEDNLFNDPHMGIWDFTARTDAVAHLDAAYGGKDTNALTIMKPLPDNRINAVGFLYQGHVKDFIPQIVDKMKYYRASKLFMENNSDRGFSLEAITSNPVAVEAGIWPKSYAESMQKEMKISKYLYEGWKRIQWANETDMNYLEQIIDWTVEADVLDDSADSASSLLREAGFVKTRNVRDLYRW
jgi:hypothetical protein